jgi:hypothetical protein
MGSLSAATKLLRGADGYETARRETVWNVPVRDGLPELLATTAPFAADTVEHLESCVCGHPPHAGSECDGGCGCTTYEPDKGRGWVRVNYIFKATSIHPQGPYPFGKAS